MALLLDPSNPNKVNQDSLVMVEDVRTGSIAIGCLDGHGVNGDILSNVSTPSCYTSIYLIFHLFILFPIT